MEAQMRRLAVLAALVTGLLGACGGGGYSDEFKAQFLQSCEASSGGATSYCQCALDHLEANGPENEEDITTEDQSAAIQACLSEIDG
jgi:hypothetical protein